MMKFLAKVTSSDLNKAMSSISAWDGKTRLAIENALQDSTKNIARGAKQKVAQRSGKLKKSIKTGFDRRKPEGLVKAKTPYAHIVEFGAKAHIVRAPPSAKAPGLAARSSCASGVRLSSSGSGSRITSARATCSAPATA